MRADQQRYANDVNAAVLAAVLGVASIRATAKRIAQADGDYYFGKGKCPEVWVVQRAAVLYAELKAHGLE